MFLNQAFHYRFLLNFLWGQVTVICPGAQEAVPELLVVKKNEKHMTEAAVFKAGRRNILEVDPEKFTLLQMYG